jgi:hypothetical protein
MTSAAQMVCSGWRGGWGMRTMAIWGYPIESPAPRVTGASAGTPLGHSRMTDAKLICDFYFFKLNAGRFVQRVDCRGDTTAPRPHQEGLPRPFGLPVMGCRPLAIQAPQSDRSHVQIESEESWLDRLCDLGARFPEYGIGSDFALMSLAEMWGLYQFLGRIAGEVLT